MYRFIGKLIGITNDDNLIVRPVNGVEFIPMVEERNCISFTLENLNNGQEYLALYLGNEIEIPRTTPTTLQLGESYVFELRKIGTMDEYTIKNLYIVASREDKFLLAPLPLVLDTIRYTEKN